MNTTYLFKSHVYAYNLFIQISVYVYNSFTQISRVWIQFIHSNLSVCFQKQFIQITVYASKTIHFNLSVWIQPIHSNCMYVYKLLIQISE